MKSVDGEGKFESVDDILRYLRFAGHDLTRDQLVRLHRRRLIHGPLSSARFVDGTTPSYPRGTAERILRVLQLRTTTKQLDELAWRLWWDGYRVEPDLVRAFLFRRAGRWDEQLTEGDDAEPAREGADAGRDVLDDVFFKHLKCGPSHPSIERQLQRGTSLFVEFTGFLRELDEDDTTFRASTFDHLDEQWMPREHPGSRRSPLGGIGLLASVGDVPYTKVVDAIEDEDFEPARRFARRVLASISSVGGIVHDVFGGSGKVRDNVGKNLVTMAESTNEQVLAFLLTTSMRHARADWPGLDDAADIAITPPAIAFGDFQRLTFLARAVPELAPLLEAERVRGVFESADAATLWRQELDDFRHQYLLEVEMAIDLESDLFDPDPPGFEVPDDDRELKSKKKILKRLRR